MAPSLEAFSGHTLLRGYPDVDPSAIPSTPQSVTSDGAAGAAAAVAALMALHLRDRTGKGQLIEMAQVENFMPLLGQAFMDYSLNRRIQKPQGNRHSSAAPCDVYPCSGEDCWVGITVYDDEQWQGLRRVLGDPEWARDARFDTVLGRHRNQDEMDSRIAEWTSSHEKYEVMHLLQGQGVPCGPVINDADAFSDPHLLERGCFQDVEAHGMGSYQMPGPIWRMSETPLSIRHRAPDLGEHNEYVYKELLGYSDQEYNRLEAEGHIGDAPAHHIP